MNRLVCLVRDCVEALPRPAVYIGGGIDSCVVLHHLHEKTKEEIYSYTFGFEGEDNEFKEAKQIADHYGTKHKELVFNNLFSQYPKILKHFNRPRWNIWVYWLAKKAHEDGRLSCYTGEGGDENFGGYWYKPKVNYIQNWMGLLHWGLPAYETVHKIFNLRLVSPLMNLDWHETYPYYDYEQHKRYLRQAYTGILPDYVVNRKKRPARHNYRRLWEKEIKQYFPSADPQSDEEIRELLNILVTQMWVESRGIHVKLEALAK